MSSALRCKRSFAIKSADLPDLNWTCCAGSVGHGGRPDCQGPGRHPRFRPIGWNHRGGLPWQPPEALQQRPHLCESGPFSTSPFQNIAGECDCLSRWVQTYIGTLLVSVNPYKELDIYNKKDMELYKGVNFFELPPHMWVDKFYSGCFAVKVLHQMCHNAAPLQLRFGGQRLPNHAGGIQQPLHPHLRWERSGEDGGLQEDSAVLCRQLSEHGSTEHRQGQNAHVQSCPGGPMAFIETKYQ